MVCSLVSITFDSQFGVLKLSMVGGGVEQKIIFRAREHLTIRLSCLICVPSR